MDNETLRSNFEYENSGMLKSLYGRKPYPYRGIGPQKRYLATTFRKKTYYLHRLVFQYHYGYTPDYVDHINGDARDNRVENLRACTPAQNQYNAPMKANNRSGAKGVVFHSKCKNKPWQAKIVVNGKVKSLGYFATVSEAAAAYDNGARKYAAQFARTNGFTNPNTTPEGFDDVA